MQRLLGLRGSASVELVGKAERLGVGRGLGEAFTWNWRAMLPQCLAVKRGRLFGHNVVYNGGE